MRRFPILFFLCLLLTFGLYAEEPVPQSPPQYSLGTQMFTFRAGPVLPLFFYFTQDADPLVTDMHLQTGGYGSIRYQGFINQNTAIGGELGYYFAYSLSDLFTSVPIQAKLTYIPILGAIEVPVSLGLGFAYNTYKEATYLSLFASAEIGLTWFFNQEWGISASVGYWLIPELYGSSSPLHIDMALSNFMPITLSINYRN
ncbi:MAG: hypothetical protein CVV52_04120 [Spirochaetae bacterium HGW-Spirochaetae-8]|jgi:hypothetical protein|nr:MAG: hypothetical protein CVV52_04120 [Spirochaetae bacterium HGW-Spirochaetae-8]